MIENINPATGELIKTFTESSKQEVELGYQKARQVQKSWARVSLDKKQEIGSKFCNLLSEYKSECADMLTCEVGKPLKESISELNATIDRSSWFVANFENAMKDSTTSLEKVNGRISWDPLGVIVNISAWNYPYFLATNVILPAVLTGNVVLYKPSEICPLTGLKIHKLFLEAGIPEEVVQCFIGGKETGNFLTDLYVDGVFFTGSNRVGSIIANKCTRRFQRLVFELGGKDAVYVADDVDIDKAAASLVSGAFYNAGQSCCSVERIYVDQKIYDNFLESFCINTKKLLVGDPFSSDTDIGPLARNEQIYVLDKHLYDARQKGAEVIFEQVPSQKGYFYNPNVVAKVDHEMLMMREESFGPIVGICSTKSDAQAKHYVSDTTYGLTAGIYTKEQQRAENFLKDLDTGTVYWNCCDRVSAFLPWSGRRGSGVGCSLGFEGLRSFLKVKSWHLNSFV
jgi:acyl-CoA reductase-like NAD-dependent aldehyde dehydrogenase